MEQIDKLYVTAC